MLKALLRAILLPAMFIIRLGLGISAFVVSLSASIIGLGVSVFALLAVVEFCIGYWQNGFMLLALSVLVSPIGFPALANLVLNSLGSVCAFIEGKLC